jgi:hypothetical protein
MTVRWAEHVERMGQLRNAYQIGIGKPEERRLLERPRRGWEIPKDTAFMH